MKSRRISSARKTLNESKHNFLRIFDFLPDGKLYRFYLEKKERLNKAHMLYYSTCDFLPEEEGRICLGNNRDEEGAILKARDFSLLSSSAKTVEKKLLQIFNFH